MAELAQTLPRQSVIVDAIQNRFPFDVRAVSDDDAALFVKMPYMLMRQDIA